MDAKGTIVIDAQYMGVRDFKNGFAITSNEDYSDVRIRGNKIYFDVQH